MNELDAIASVLFPGLIVLFVVTQGAYFVNNVLVDLLILRRKPALVTDATEPETLPTIDVLVPLYGEHRAVIEETLAGIAAMDYPLAKLEVYLVTERDDERVESYVDEVIAAFGERGLAVERTTVDRSTIASYISEGTWDISGSAVPRTKASAIKYAFRTLSLPAEDVVTVFDADTIVPPDTFRLAVAGLESYDVVQAKQTVRNHGDGWLPRLEAMGMAAWSNALYAKTTAGPYQLLGKAYFLTVEDLWAIGDWRVDAITEDLALGMDAYEQGYTLGVVDRYVQDICPADFGDWIAQKRRWASGPYPYLRSESLSLAELVRFWAYGASNQVVSVLNVVGVPAGILYFLFVLAGFDLYNSPPLAVVTVVNLVNWAYYTVRTYQATLAGMVFADRREALAFYLASNPLTQLVYSMLWAIPISLAVWDYARGKQSTEFHVTPKEVESLTGRPELLDDTVPVRR